MWKVVLAVLIAGVGTVVAFGFLLLGLKLANRLGTGGARSEGSRIVGYALAGACAVICAAVVVIGIYAMTKKQSLKPAKPKSALVVPAEPREADRLIPVTDAPLWVITNATICCNDRSEDSDA